MEDIAKLESTDDEKNAETLQKLKDILVSMDLDRELRQECDDRLAAAAKKSGDGDAGRDDNKS
jgi:hypothetical protein